LSTTRDAVLIEEYARIPDQSSEAIIRDPELSGLLLSRVNKRLPREHRFDQVELKRRLENLRKTSRLPRKFREFNGRNLSKEKPR